MSGELVQLTNEASPYVMAALSAYGGAILAQVQEEAATSTLGVGRRIARRVFGTVESGTDLPDVLTDLAHDPDDPDFQGALRAAMRRALATDPEMAAEVRRLVAEAPQPSVTASGARSVAVHTNTGIIMTGDRNRIQR